MKMSEADSIGQAPEPYVRLPNGTLPAVFAVAAIWAYFMQPTLRLADAHQLSIGSLFFGVGLLLTIGGNIQRKWLEGMFGLAALLFGSSVLAMATDNAVAIAQANDKRCGRIEVAMLAPEPLRDDLPAIFTALGCRPQYANAADVPPKRKLN